VAFEDHDEIPEDISAEPQELSGANPIMFYSMSAGLVLLIFLLVMAY
jgi:hypothetical protein